MASEPIGIVVGIVVGLGAEARIARRLGWPVAIGGGTPAGAEAAARRLTGQGVSALLSFGLAGGLDPALRAGAVVAPRTVLADAETFATDPGVLGKLGGDPGGSLLAAVRPVTTAAEKRSLFAETGAGVVDLESGAVARAAQRAGLPFAALRAVCDPADFDLPSAAIVALDGEGAIGPWRVLGSLARAPSQLPALLRLARDAARARRALLAAVRLVLALIALTIAVAGPARAQPGPRQAALCGVAIGRAEQRYQTPPGLLVTIGKVESGRRDEAGTLAPWPWTINADGEGYFFTSKADAVAWARAALAGGVQYMDVGCMQVDLEMHPLAFRTLDDAFDPEVNADYAARFLRSLHDEAGGNWYTAIGLYHSHTPDLAAYYRLAVAAVGAGLPMPGMGPRALHVPLTRIALSGGGATMLNLRRQPARVHRPVNACRIAAVLGSYLRSRPAGCKRS